MMDSSFSILLFSIVLNLSAEGPAETDTLAGRETAPGTSLPCVKDERIAELETENAVLHLRLAEYQERMNRSSRDTWHSVLFTARQCRQGSAHSALLQLCCLTGTLKQDVKEFRSSSLVLLNSFQEEFQHRFSDIAAIVQKTQLCNEALQACQAEVIHLHQSLQELDARYQLEQQRRRALHNSMVELKGNIRVHCRIRPLLPFDKEFHSVASQKRSISGEVTHAIDGETVLVRCVRPGYPAVNKTYSFERVYSPAESQAVVFGDVCPLLTSLMDGYNVCILAYGQTGSGKSYTMLGPHSEDEPRLLSGTHGDLGIIPRAAEELFRLISENPSRSSKVDVSIVEIYNNDIFDLLAKDDSVVVSGVKREAVTTQEGRTEVPLLTCRTVISAVEFVEVIHEGLQLRARHPTLVHKNSSRSHLVVTATLTTVSFLCRATPKSSQASLQEKARAHHRRTTTRRASSTRPSLATEDHTGQMQARLQLVDLAGSECAGMSGVTGLALKETFFINRSLAALADVLGALSEHRDHIPYRNSKLTHLLQDSIGGDAKLLVILCVSPGQRHVAETLRGLRFGTRARQIERRLARKKPPSSQTRKLAIGSMCAVKTNSPALWYFRYNCQWLLSYSMVCLWSLSTFPAGP